MNSNLKSVLSLAFFATFVLAADSVCWSQQSDLLVGNEAAEIIANEGEIVGDVNSLPFENSFGYDSADISVFDPAMASAQTESQCDACETCEGQVVTDQQLFPEVKNVNFFGVDRDSCCDEWSGFCRMKSLKYGCNCGGLKADKGHFGLSWLKGRNGGEDCDYCNGGCCKDGNCNRGGRTKGCSCQNKTIPRLVFGRPVQRSCDQCGCCDQSCPPEEGCESCK